MRTRNERGSVKVLAVLLALAVVPASWVGLAALGFPVAGVNLFDSEELAPEAKPAAQITRADFTNTPAGEVFRGTFKDLDKVWNPSPIEVDAAGLPHPLDCVQPAPTLSNSKAYEADGKDAQVTLAAYPAGLGGEMFKRLKEDVSNCKPSTTSTYVYDVSGVGVEAATIQVNWAGNAVETTLFRRGDVVAFVATDAGVDSAGRASVVDGALTRLMTPEVCLNQSAGAEDQLRNALFAGKNFKGKGEKYPLTTEKLPLPKLTQEQKYDGVEQVKLGAPKLSTPSVTLPNADYPYPLWPELPSPRTVPDLPSVPKAQKLKSDARIRVPDLQGPGCGWAFLTTVQPSYDAAAVEANNEKLIDSAQTLLDNDGKRWQRQVRKYWTAYHNYVVAINDYRSYASEVQTVAAAWQEIHEDWSQYYTDYANWEIYEDGRLQFLADQKQARTDWAEAKQYCKDYPALVEQYNTDHAKWEQDYAKWQQDHAQWEQDYRQWEKDMREYRKLKNDDDPSNDIPKPEKPVEPQAPTEPQPPTPPAGGCPAPKPAILEQKAPEQKPAPKPPADPRPVGERD